MFCSISWYRVNENYGSLENISWQMLCKENENCPRERLTPAVPAPVFFIYFYDGLLLTLVLVSLKYHWLIHLGTKKLIYNNIANQPSWFLQKTQIVKGFYLE